MLTVYNCIAHAHDLRLVGLAALICLLASFTAINLLHHMRHHSRPDHRSSEAALPTGLLAIAVACASFIIIVLALAGVALELRARRRGELETERGQGLPARPAGGHPNLPRPDHRRSLDDPWSCRSWPKRRAAERVSGVSRRGNGAVGPFNLC